MSTETNDVLPNLLMIVGRGVPSNYEITVDGELELVEADSFKEATVVTDHSAEGAVDIGVIRFRFSGQMANVHIVDWNGVAAPGSPSTPEVHINYGVSSR